ncbi:MAG TPA: hypothetical protein VHG52_13400 [Thermomicrobiales bacterium]|nr:hypothetical protein [Thermomicrobiales bacterium]
MRRFHVLRSMVPLVLVVVLTGALQSGVKAQGATPTADFITPDPDECMVEPRSLEALTALAAPSGAAATPQAAAESTPSDLPTGGPADAETIAAVTATATELFACYNANDLLRVFALFTDDYLERAFAAEGVTGEALGFFAAPQAARPEEERESVSVRDVQVLPDGRVGAFLVVRNPAAADSEAVDFTVFVEAEGRYLIDDVVFLTPGAIGTPTP